MLFPHVTTVEDNNNHLTSVNNNSLPIVSQTQDDTGNAPVDDYSDNEDIPIASDSKGSEHNNIAKQLNVAMDRIDYYLAAELK